MHIIYIYIYIYILFCNSTAYGTIASRKCGLTRQLRPSDSGVNFITYIGYYVLCVIHIMFFFTFFSGCSSGCMVPGVRLHPRPLRERAFFFEILLVRIHLIIVMILVDRPCAMGV